MTVMSVSDVYSQADVPKTNTDKVMGKEDFLTLLVAQLQHQDPLNPAEGTEFTAQLAQFSSLEQLQNIDATLRGFELYQSTLNNIQSTGFIGKTVMAAGNGFSVTDALPEPLRFDLSNDADSVYIQIYDNTETFVGDITVGARPAGAQQVDWDGRDANGLPVTDGHYTFTVMAMNNDGSIVGATSYTTGLVTGIDYKDGSTNLLVHNREIPISSVVRIEETVKSEQP